MSYIRISEDLISNIPTPYRPHAQERNGRGSQGTWERPYMCTYTLRAPTHMSSAVWYPSHACGVTSSNATTWPLGFAQLWPENISPSLIYIAFGVFLNINWSPRRQTSVKQLNLLAGWLEVLHQESIIVRPIILVQLISHDCIRLRH